MKRLAIVIGLLSGFLFGVATPFSKLLFLPGSRMKTAGIVFFGGFAGPLLLLAGLKTANAALVSIWLNMELVATAILGVIIFKDSLDKNTWIGVGLTVLAGIVTSLG